MTATISDDVCLHHHLPEQWTASVEIKKIPYKESKAQYTVWTLIFAVLNFRGLRIFAFSPFLFSRMRIPQYYIKYIDYISVLISALH